MSASPQDLSRTSSLASSSNDTITSQHAAAALRGATSAFGGNRTTGNGNATNYKANGALAAATSAGPVSPSRSLNRTLTSESVQSIKSEAGSNTLGFGLGKMLNQQLPLPPRRELSKSPSHQAASLATARAPPPSPKPGPNDNVTRTASTRTPAVPPKPRRISSHSISGHPDNKDKPTDSTSIAPTTSLVSMFEEKATSPPLSGKMPGPIVVKPSDDTPLKSPKPVRASSGITSMISMEVQNARDSPTPTQSKPAVTDFTTVKENDAKSQSDLSSDVVGDLGASRPPLPPPRKKAAASVSETTYLEPIKALIQPRGRPGPPKSPLRSSLTDPITIEHSENLGTSPTELFAPSSASVKSLSAQYNQLHPRKITPNMTGDQLANAMVAGNLASSRQASPNRNMDPPPLPNRRHKHHTFSLSRTPSPSKAGMRKTLRQTQSDTDSDAEDERLYPYSKHKMQKRLGKHPNKHHEGDRKRWRESVSEHERKRYEGVWAANKGLYYSWTVDEKALISKQSDSQQAQDIIEAVADQVSNIVVREIWSRSRLPDTVLETVWDLVDHEQIGRLNKAEFVVGLWLIDGRLKGKKLPVKVSDSVWRSVKGLNKIKIRK